MRIKLRTIVASVALAASVPAIAAFHSTPAPAVPCSQHQSLGSVDRNQSNFFAQCDWDKRIKLSGSINTAFGVAADVWGYHGDGTDSDAMHNDFNHSLTFHDNVVATANENVDSGNDLWLQRAVLNVDAVLNSWAEAHMSFLYWNDKSIMNNADAMMYNRYHGSWQNVRGDNSNNLPIDEASLVIGNFAQSPFFMRVGRQYGDFGSYDKGAEVATLTQLFSQGLHDAAQIGFVDIMGFNGSISAFRTVARDDVWDKDTAINTPSEDRPDANVNNFIASLGYSYDSGSFGVDAKVDYMHDIFGVDFLDGYNGNGILGRPGGYQEHGDDFSRMRPEDNTPAVAVSLKANFAGFDVTGQWVSATHDMDKTIWTTGGDSGVTDIRNFQLDGARPSAWLAELGYSFPLMGRDSRLSVNYQRTDEAMVGNTTTTNYYIPEKRYAVSFNHSLMKNVDLGLTYYRDKDYGTDHFQSANNMDANGDDLSSNQFSNLNGTGNSNSMFLMNLSAKFN